MWEGVGKQTIACWNSPLLSISKGQNILLCMYVCTSQPVDKGCVLCRYELTGLGRMKREGINELCGDLRTKEDVEKLQTSREQTNRLETGKAMGRNPVFMV